MAAIRYESLLVEQALSREYAAEMERTLKGMGGLNDIKPMIRDFEGEFAGYIGVKEAVAVNSGSDALKMVLLAAGVGQGDEVIVGNLTYQAVALAVFYCGAKPVPVDARADDLQMDPDAIEAVITKKTKALIAAHMFGRPCDVDKIGKLCRRKNIVFIEDVCQAESSRYKGQMLGSFGDMAAFSFSYYKPLSSCGGGGGMVIFKKDEGKRIRRWMEDWRNDEELLKLGQRFAPMPFMDLIALKVKFSRLKEIIKSRHKIKALYEQGLGSIEGLTIFKDRPQTESVAQNFVVCCQQRDQLTQFLAAQGVVVQKAYVPLHQMAAFKKTKKENFPVSETYAATALHLPLHSFMSPEKAGDVIRILPFFFCRKQTMKPLLNDITIEITNHCQLHCQHCGIWAEKERHEMTSSMVVRMMRELLGRYRINYVSITGGEPFLNRNCGRLLKAMSFFREKGQITGFGVYSNAAYFEGVRRVFSTYGEYLRGMQMGISIDGTEETHDRLRGAGAYQKTLKTIEWLSENAGNGIILEFKFTINRINYAELGDVYRLARRFKARFSPKIMESGVSDYYHRHQMPDTDTLAALTAPMVESVRSQVTGMLSDGYKGVDRQLVEAMMVLLAGGRKCIRACETPAKSLFINSRRNVYPCLYLSPAGKVGTNGELPQDLDSVRQKHTDDAAQGHCPGCFAYHGFLKKFNLPYLIR